MKQVKSVIKTLCNLHEAKNIMKLGLDEAIISSKLASLITVTSCPKPDA